MSLSRIREEQIALTEDQYRLLDYLEEADRILCTGAAGTGKTFIAAECLRREPKGSSILVTGTESLAEHLRAENIPTPENVVSFREAADRMSSLGGRFDVLIVDEGQQVTNQEAIAVLAKLLRKPFGDARWRWFSDPHHQLTAASNFEPRAQGYLESLCNVAPRLRENCRNTSQIVRAVEYASGVSLGTTRVRGSGPEVRYAQARDQAGLVEEAAAQARAWVQEHEVAPGEIMLLSPGPVGESQIPAIARGAGMPYKQWHRGWSRSGPAMGACTIEGFRGLESPFVLLCDLRGEVDQLSTSLYLGMTRANFGVFVCCDRASRERLVEVRMASQATTGA